MNRNATQAFHNRLAVVFDFDETLAPSSFDLLLEGCGWDPERFRREHVAPLAADGWDQALAMVYALIRASRDRGGPPITRERIAEVGRSIEPYDGALEMFDRVRRHARGIVPDVEVEFYLLTCGFVDLHRESVFADRFDAMWGSELHFDERGHLAFAKQIVYVGDGGSDMPTFELLNQHGGTAIGVFEADSPEGWSGHEDIRADRRVDNLAPADYREDGELLGSLLLAVERVCAGIRLRRLGAGE